MSEGVTLQTGELNIDKRSKCELESDAFLNQASLDYLINTKQYKIQFTSSTENAINRKINRKDKKFYRKRIKITELRKIT